MRVGDTERVGVLERVLEGDWLPVLDLLGVPVLEGVCWIVGVRVGDTERVGVPERVLEGD